MTGIRVYPWGYPVDIQSSSAQVLDAAAALWGEWPQLFRREPLSFQIEVTDDADAANAAASIGLEIPAVRSANGKLQLRSAQGSACFSSETRSGHMRIHAAALRDPAWFSYFWLQSLVPTSLDMVFFEPLHAAGIARGDRGVLLCGDSGAGKTTLAYACVKARWTLLSDDGVRLAETEAREQALVGGRWTFHLREPACALFPELASRPVEVTLNAKRSIIVDARESGMNVSRMARPHSTVFLRRHPGPARIAPFSVDDALCYFSKTAQNPDRDLSARRLRAMLGERCMLLEYEDVRDAVAQLDRLL